MRRRPASNKRAKRALTFWVIRSVHTASKRLALVSGCKSVEEERCTYQAESGRPSGTKQRGVVVGGAGSTQSDSERLVRLLQLRHYDEGVSGGRLLRLRQRTPLPSATSSSAVAWQYPLLAGCGLRPSGRCPVAPCPDGVSFVSLVVKPVGKPDAGNSHVRFDERGWETGRRLASVLAPILDSTR